MYCCISTCSSRYGKNQVTFHRFPQNNEARRERWIEAAGRGNQINYNYATVCSLHFVSGKPSRVSDCESVDWVPSLLLSTVTPVRGPDTRRSAEAQPIEDDMNDSCMVRGCTMTKEENPSLLFFPLPQEKPVRNKWLLQIGMHNNLVSMARAQKQLTVCELHFELSKDLQNYDDVITMGRTPILKNDVMPTRNIPVVFGHQTVSHSSETPENAGIVPKEEPPEEDSLLQEMKPRGEANDDEAMPEYPAHLQTSPVEEFAQICRSCLSTDKSTLVSAFEDNLVDIFYQFTTITITESEEISTLICQDCKARLLELHFFRDSCVTNTQILIHRYQKCYGLATGSDDEGDGDAHMNDFSSGLENHSTDNHESRQLDSRTDDPEDLLEPQKEEVETDEGWQQRNVQPKPKIKDAASKIKKRYKCKICRKDYNSKPGIEMHMAGHKDDDPADFTVECRNCDRLRRPTDKHSCTQSNLYCHVCAQRFRSWSYLKIHLAKIHKIKTQRRELMLQLKTAESFDQFLKSPPKRVAVDQDQDSEQAASGSSGRNTPVRTHHYHKCGFCDAAYKHASALESHLKTHADVEQMQCNECSEVYSNFRHLQDHHQQHQNETDIPGLVNKCNICGKMLGRRQTLLLHRQNVHRDSNVVQCGTCSTLFSHPRSLTEHQCPNEKSSAGLNGDFSIVNPESILKRASVISLDDEPSVSVDEHGDNADPLLGLGNEEVIELESDDDSTQDKTSFDCTVCGKTFEKEDVLDRHMKLHRMMNAAKANEIGRRN